MAEQVDMLSKPLHTERLPIHSVNYPDDTKQSDNDDSYVELHKTTGRFSKKRLQRFSNNSSASYDEAIDNNLDFSCNVLENESEEDVEIPSVSKNVTTIEHKSRIRSISSSESDNDVSKKVDKALGNSYDLSRIKNKKKKLAEKFNKLVSKKQKSSIHTRGNVNSSNDSNASNNTENSDDDLNSCDKIKKLVKKKQKMQMSSICDPDTSEDEDMKQHKKSRMKMIKLTSPKAVRMSAKQAMENMQKIKSEANRMLREKEVSLPYHRPKALSLKDIMSRRKPALAADGKVLSVKMTAEQLEQYAVQLEQRQKEMMELCKSDGEDEDCEKSKEIEDSKRETGNDKIDKSSKDTSTPDINNIIKLNDDDNADAKENIVISEDLVEEDNKTHPAVDSENILNSEDVINKEIDSQEMELHYDSEKLNSCNIDKSGPNDGIEKTKYTNETDCIENISISKETDAMQKEDEMFDDNDGFNSEDIIILNNIEMMEQSMDVNLNKGKQTIEVVELKEKPKLMGAPGMVIDLNINDTLEEKKLSGVELLKERFQYFANLQSLEEQEKDREKKYKPGTQHLKLKHELEQQIAEQRCLEWSKRLENENQRSELDDESDADDIEKLEAKLEDLDETKISEKESSESSEEDVEEEDCIIEDKPRKRNPMLDDEAEESEIEQDDIPDVEVNGEHKERTNVNDDLNESDEDEESSESSDSENDSSKSDCDHSNGKRKQGRILKAFEDSDDEAGNDNPIVKANKDEKYNEYIDFSQISSLNDSTKKDLNNSTSQDEELQLAQVHKTSSADTIVSTCAVLNQQSEVDVGSQSFSIANSEKSLPLTCLDKLIVKESTYNKTALDHNNLYLDNFTQNLNSQQESTASLDFGDDIAALCTGKFYDNPLLSQNEEMQVEDNINLSIDITQVMETNDKNIQEEKQDTSNKEDKQLLNSILEELNDPEFESQKPYKYFANDDPKTNKENMSNVANITGKKKFIIDSEDENDMENVEKQTKKKVKRRKIEKRALQISDDEEDFGEATEEMESAESDLDEEDPDRVVDYDSEENEVVVQLPKAKKKRAAGTFFEQEAELTSEDEWIGSGDEDEVGLDRMEREEGDDEVFQEDKLRNELGQIHMRDVLDQDKREVRLLQELLFEDGDLGDGHRQRKFRWKNTDDGDETNPTLDFGETQEEEFESEEQWRKQRHEREVFLRKMKGVDEEDLHSSSINRTAIIKANLCSRTMSSLLSDANEDDTAQNAAAEKKPNKNIPSPKKSFPVFQQNYHGSLLSRGKGTLARLAAIATPLATDDDSAPKASGPTNRGNFVFAALTQDEDKPKISKRKAETAALSPDTSKKMKTADKKTNKKSSLLDYL